MKPLTFLSLRMAFLNPPIGTAGLKAAWKGLLVITPFLTSGSSNWQASSFCDLQATTFVTGLHSHRFAGVQKFELPLKCGLWRGGALRRQ